MPTFRSSPIRRAATAALAGAMILTILPAATTIAASPASPEIRAAERKVLAHMNEFRANHGLRPLRMAGGLRVVARQRSRSMKNANYFAHTSPAGIDAGDLLRRRSISHRFWGENIGWTRYMDLNDGAKWMHDWWKSSPGHRYNMLYRGYNYVGIGIAKEGPELTYTVVFASQRDHTPPTAGLYSASTGISVASASGPKPVTIRWWGKDRLLSARTSGLRGFNVQHRTDNGEWRTVRKMTRTHQLTASLSQGTHWFRVRAFDNKGNGGQWKTPLKVVVR